MPSDTVKEIALWKLRFTDVVLNPDTVEVNEIREKPHPEQKGQDTYSAMYKVVLGEVEVVESNEFESDLMKTTILKIRAKTRPCVVITTALEKFKRTGRSFLRDRLIIWN